jgi:hypothetical protein
MFGVVGAARFKREIPAYCEKKSADVNCAIRVAQVKTIYTPYLEARNQQIG